MQIRSRGESAEVGGVNNLLLGNVLLVMGCAPVDSTPRHF